MDFGVSHFTFNSSAWSKYDGLQWYECRPAFFVFLASEMFNTSLGLFTNIWMLILILRDWKNQAGQEIFTVNLAMLEIIYCLLSQFLMLNYVVLKIMSINGYSWFVYSLNFFGRSLFQCGMSVERYVAVVHPVFFFRHQFLKCKVCFLVLGWLLTAVFIWFIGRSPTMSPVMGLFNSLVSINLYCSLRILVVLRRPSPGAAEGKKGKEISRKKKRACYTVMIIQATILFNYIPLLIASELEFSLDPYTFFCVYQPLGYACCLMGCFLQPLLFLHRVGKLQWPSCKESPCK